MAFCCKPFKHVLSKGKGVEQSLLIRVRIRYKPGEFAGFVCQRTAMRSQQRGRRGLIGQMALAGRMAWMPVEYLLQLVQQGAIHLHIDQTGMRWRTRDGVVCLFWGDVLAVGRTAEGTVIHSLDGWWFLPDRVLSTAHKTQLAAVFAQLPASLTTAGAAPAVVAPEA